MMKKIMWIISIIPLAVTVVVLKFMPESVPMHYDALGNVDRWGSRYENLIFPAIILIIAVFMNFLIIYYERKAKKTEDDKERAGSLSNVKILGIIGTMMAAMFGVMQCFILYGAYTGAKSEATTATVDMGRVSCILIGLLFMVLGNFMTKTRINGSVGVRISWSMYNDNTWKKSNHFGAIAMIIAGILTIITAVLMKNSFGAAMTAVGYICAASAVTMIYAHKVYVEEIKLEKTGGKQQ